MFSTPSDPSAVTTTFEYRGERLRWAQTEDVRAYHRYDDFGNVVRIRQHARQGGVFPDIDDNAPQGSGCGEVPSDVANDETYYCYDEFERLRLSRGAGVPDPEFVDYDGLDRRDLRRVQTSGGTRIRDFSYVGTSELLSREVEVDGDKRFYDYDAQGDRLGQQVNTGSTNRYRAYTKDANGSVLGLEDDTGDVGARRYEYDPYGDLENAGELDGEGEANPFRFEGFYYDSGVRSYDMHARHYRPDVGRFLTQDRLASASQDLLLQADPLTQNRYAFAGANPVNNVEFDGHDPHAIDTGESGCFKCGGSRRAARAVREVAEAGAEHAQTMQTSRAAARAFNDQPDYHPPSSGQEPTGRPALGAPGSLQHPGPRTLKPVRSLAQYPGEPPHQYPPKRPTGGPFDLLGGVSCALTFGAGCFGDPNTELHSGGNVLGNLNPKGAATAAVRNVVRAVTRRTVRRASTVPRNVRSRPPIAGAQTFAETSRAARRSAMREAGIPTSATPVERIPTKAGDQYIYAVPKPGGGSRRWAVTHHAEDPLHGPHWEAGVVRLGSRDPLGRYHYYGQDPITRRLKARVPYGDD